MLECMCRDNPKALDALDRMRAKVRGELNPALPNHGEIGGGHTRGDNVTSAPTTERGNESTYTLRRLKRDAPALAQRVLDGELSAILRAPINTVELLIMYTIPLTGNHQLEPAQMPSMRPFAANTAAIASLLKRRSSITLLCLIFQNKEPQLSTRWQSFAMMRRPCIAGVHH